MKRHVRALSPIALSLLVACGQSEQTKDEADGCPGAGCSTVPSCTGETESELCARAQKECGALSVTDRCLVQRNLTCGTCAGTETCTSGQCVNVNPCLTDNGGCDDNATCSFEVDAPVCACKEGFVGNGLTCFGPQLTSTGGTFWVGYHGDGFTCQEDCVAEGHLGCSDQCVGTPGSARYKREINSFTTYQSTDVDSCTATIAPSIEVYSQTYELYEYSCCCLTMQQVVDGDVTEPKSCNEVCAQYGLTCNPEAEWSEGEDGAQVGYARSSGYHVFLQSCETVPELTRSYSGGTETLDSQRCGCM